jgi:hypothetical protein
MCNIFFTSFRKFFARDYGPFFPKTERKMAEFYWATLSLNPQMIISWAPNCLLRKSRSVNSGENWGETRSQAERSPQRLPQARLLLREFAPMVLRLASVHR